MLNLFFAHSSNDQEEYDPIKPNDYEEYVRERKRLKKEKKREKEKGKFFIPFFFFLFFYKIRSFSRRKTFSTKCSICSSFYLL